MEEGSSDGGMSEADEGPACSTSGGGMVVDGSSDGGMSEADEGPACTTTPTG